MLRKWIALCIMLLVSGCTGIDNNTAQETAPRMTKDQLKARMGSPGLILLDVRAENDWSNSTQKIKGAIRLNPKAYEQWAGKYSMNDTLVLYCA
jgi:rhodanese-related sulfurtransferase